MKNIEERKINKTVKLEICIDSNPEIFTYNESVNLLSHPLPSFKLRRIIKCRESKKRVQKRFRDA